MNPCPFCASPPEPAIHPRTGESLGVECSNPDCILSLAYMSEEQWSRRAVDESGVERVAFLVGQQMACDIEEAHEMAQEFIDAYLGKVKEKPCGDK